MTAEQGRAEESSPPDNSPAIFDRHQASLVRGTAIIMLVLHHCFLFPTPDPWYSSILPGSPGTVEFFLASVSKLCIPLFFFVSGYGLWTAGHRSRHPWTETFGRVRRIYTVYVTTVLVTVILFTLRDNSLPLHSLRQAVDTFLGLNFSLNGSWWFFIIYVELLILTPPAVYFVRRFSWQPLLVLSLCIYLLSPESGFPNPFTLQPGQPLTNLLSNFFPLGFFWPNQFYFFTGFCLAASGKFEHLLKWTIARLPSPRSRHLLALTVLLTIFILRYFLIDLAGFFHLLDKSSLDIFHYTMISSRADFILGPVTVFFLVLLLYQHRLESLDLIGRNSAAIWLIHESLLSVLKPLVKSWHPWSPLVFFTILLLSLGYALLYSRLGSLIHSRLART